MNVSSGENAVQAALWDTYLSSGNNNNTDPIQTASDLFRTIDLDKSGKISPGEIDFFLNAIGRRGIDEEEVQELMDLGQDHELNENEFSVWLAGAVCPDGDHASEDYDPGLAPKL